MQNNRQNKLQELLKSYRINNNLRQSDLAKKLDKPQSFVSKYESGEKHLSFLEVQDICKALNISFSIFASQFEDKFNESK